MTDEHTLKEALRTRLTQEQYEVTQNGATERAFTGLYNNFKESGSYHCICCDALLFTSQHKYDSGSGWPSFDRPAADQAAAEHTDRSHGMVRTEVTCSSCKAHLGHVFPDGPRDTTSLRYCINSASLQFQSSEE